MQRLLNREAIEYRPQRPYQYTTADKLENVLLVQKKISKLKVRQRKSFPGKIVEQLSAFRQEQRVRLQKWQEKRYRR